MRKIRLSPILPITLFAILALASCGTGSSRQQSTLPPGGPSGFDLVLIPAGGNSLEFAPFEALRYDKGSGEFKSVAVPALPDTREYAVVHSPRGDMIFSAANELADNNTSSHILLRKVLGDGSISSVQQDVLLANGWTQDLGMDASGSWLLVVRGHYVGIDLLYWLESYPVASDGTLGAAIKIWQAPIPTLIAGASSAPQFVEVFNRTSINEDVWVWVHTFQLDNQDGLLAENGTLYKLTLNAGSGEAGNIISHDFGEDFQFDPSFAQGAQFGFLARTWRGELRTISSATLDQISECAGTSQPSCNPVEAVTANSDGSRLFTINLINNISSLNVSSTGAVTPMATERMNIAGLPTDVASDARGTTVFVGSNGLYPSSVKTITGFKVLADGSLAQGASVNSKNAERIDVISH
jgi:hypothetical protein